MRIAVLVPVLGTIPSPSFNSLELGPLTLRLYGLAIALGVIAAVVISSKRWEARGGDPDDIGNIALWAVPAGVIGSRIYHVATDWKTYQDDWLAAFNITNGGLGIPGGIALGTIVGLIVVKRKNLPAAPLLDVVAPAIPVAQAIGRLGNYFNQELFGRPTGLPWGLKIDPENVPAGYSASQAFHPTFLYEGLWNLALAGVLVLVDRRRKLRAGELFTLYVLGYAVGRLWVEELRIDNASLILGIRVNIWMSVIVALVALALFAYNRSKPAPAPAVIGSTARSDVDDIDDAEDVDGAVEGTPRTVTEDDADAPGMVTEDDADAPGMVTEDDADSPGTVTEDDAVS